MGLQSKSIEILFLPPNTTSRLAPFDAGIIAAFKMKYKNKFILSLLEKQRQQTCIKNKLSILEAINFVVESWNEITPRTITNCWLHTSLVCESKLKLDKTTLNSELCDEKNIYDETNELKFLISELDIPNKITVQEFLSIEDRLNVD
jgi:hypothetical protein